MSDKEICFKDYITCKDDDMLSKTRKKMNKKSHKGRHYGTDHGYTPGEGGDAGGLSEMHDGVIPAAFTANVISRLPDGTTGTQKDMKKENRRNAPRKRSFAEYLKYRNAAEEEEMWDDEDEPMNDFDRLERNRDRDPEYDQFRDEFEDDELDPEMRQQMGLPDDDDPELDPTDDDGEFDFLNKLRALGSSDYGVEGQTSADDDWGDTFDGAENEEDFIDDDFDDEEFDDDPDEYDDLDPEEELDFEGGSCEGVPAYDEDSIDDEDIEDIDRVTGTFADFYRMDNEIPGEEDDFEEEAEEFGPGGFEPGQAVGPDTQTSKTSGAGAGTKIHKAKVLFGQLINNPELERRDIIDAFIAQLGVTESTAVSYYERLAKEAGLTKGNDAEQGSGGFSMDDDDEFGEEGMGDEEMMEPEMPQEEIDQQPPDRQGVIRQVDNAHLVYKRQMEDGGFEELWVYNIADKLDDALQVRRAILSGTDIPRGHTRSEDGQQSYTLSTMGNAQLLHITGLSN